MAVLLGEVFETQTNAIQTAKFLAEEIERSQLPFDEDFLTSVVKTVNDSSGCSVDGAKIIYVKTQEAFGLPPDIAGIEFIHNDFIEKSRMNPGWYHGFLHSIEWIGSLAFNGLGARMFNLIPVYAEEPKVFETAFLPVTGISTVIAAS